LMPGRQYELIESELPGTNWNGLSGLLIQAGALDLQLSHTNVTSSSLVQRYYRLRLLP